MQTREKFYFICEKWFAIDKDDFQIERNIILSTEQDKIKYKYLFSKEIKNDFCDTHLWFSVFARPIQSTFTRLDRLTCCFVLLSMSMMMNIMYYGILDNSSSGESFKLGPYLNFSLQEISVGLLSNLFLFFPSILLVQLFKRIKRRNTRIDKIRKILKQKETTKKPFQLKFPWWFKIIAYLLSFVFASVSLFFVILKGIEFGEEKVAKWLSSLLIGFFSSIFLTQPLKVSK